MKPITIVIATLLSSTVVHAGHMDGMAFQAVPVMSEIGLFAFAIAAGLAGAWGIRRMREKD